jgi:hypothetical protein
MSKKKKLRETQGPKDKPVERRKVDETPEDEKTKAMDFGGLPDRNLKKNLGCG